VVTSRKSKFAHTKHSLTLLERLAQCLNMGEPALLVGETGNSVCEDDLDLGSFQ